MNHREVLSCRICAGPLENVLDLGTQCLSGQFPAQGEADPPAFPLVLAHCKGQCGLMQLTATVNPELMFWDYWYRSGVTQTMNKHLQGIAEEAVKLSNLEQKTCPRILDIGCNDGTLLSYLNGPLWQRVGIDPNHEARVPEGATLIPSTYPCNLGDSKFDLILSIACFYDVDDPVAFAKSIKSNLAPEGLWCCEVADLRKMLTTGAYDTICHEHLCYYDYWTFYSVLSRAGLKIVHMSKNNCNGGSLRFYVAHEDRPLLRTTEYALPTSREMLVNFVETVKRNRALLRDYLERNRMSKKSPDAVGKIHLLGASTKANTWLQYCLGKDHPIQMASDRDPRKHGRRTPGTHIPIVSEEESRALEPDMYMVGPWHFDAEIIQREQEFLKKGGKLVFPLPKLLEVTA